MIHRLFIIFSLLLFTTCDDGDILTVQLEFDKELEFCTNDTGSFLIYDLREDPNESLSLIIPRSANQDFPFTEPLAEDDVTDFSINETTVRFIYRTYNRAVVSSGANQELCDVVPPATLNIVEDYEADSGDVDVIVTIDDDDGDGISSEDEGRDPNGDGDFSDALNTDGDAFPDYLDEDDDNDNVKTINELDSDDADGDDNPFTNPLDTDGDGTPDYLDDDDDGDDILTRLEDESGEKNPRDPENFVVDENGINVYRYLYNHPDAMEAFPDLGLTDDNQYTRTVNVNFVISDFSLEILTAEEIDFGTLTYSFTLPEDEE